jgi:hypothetical protein
MGEVELVVRGMENRLARVAKKEPIPVPHAPRVAFASLVTCAATTLGGRGGDIGVGGAGMGSSVLPLLATFLGGATAISVSVVVGVSVWEELLLLGRCMGHLPLIPSTAFRKLVEPVLKALDKASRVGASFCSIFNSRIVSEICSPMSVTADGLSMHGCLYTTC